MPIIFTITKKHPSRNQFDLRYVVKKGHKFNQEEFEKFYRVKISHAEAFSIRVKIASLGDDDFLQIGYCKKLTNSWIHRLKEWLKD